MGRKKMEIINMTIMTYMTTTSTRFHIGKLYGLKCHIRHIRHIYPIVIPKIINCNT